MIWWLLLLVPFINVFLSALSPSPSKSLTSAMRAPPGRNARRTQVHNTNTHPHRKPFILCWHQLSVKPWGRDCRLYTPPHFFISGSTLLSLSLFLPLSPHLPASSPCFPPLSSPIMHCGIPCFVIVSCNWNRKRKSVSAECVWTLVYLWGRFDRSSLFKGLFEGKDLVSWLE